MRRTLMLAAVAGLLATACTTTGGGVGVQVRVFPWLWVSGWTGGWASPPEAPPDLALVATAVRPRRARVVLDGRVIGLADDFDGYPDYLYLQPGAYTVRLELGGYRPREVPLTVKAGRAYELRVRLQRDPGQRKEGWREARASAPRPVERVFAPAPPRQRAERAREGGAQVRVAELGSLELSVWPPEAEVVIDGERYGTARELAALGHPIALPSGVHVVEVRAGGFVPARREARIEPGATVRLEVRLERAPGHGEGQPREGEGSRPQDAGPS